MNRSYSSSRYGMGQPAVTRTRTSTPAARAPAMSTATSYGSYGNQSSTRGREDMAPSQFYTSRDTMRTPELGSSRYRPYLGGSSRVAATSHSSTSYNSTRALMPELRRSQTDILTDRSADMGSGYYGSRDSLQRAPTEYLDEPYRRPTGIAPPSRFAKSALEVGTTSAPRDVYNVDPYNSNVGHRAASRGAFSGGALEDNEADVGIPGQKKVVSSGLSALDARRSLAKPELYSSHTTPSAASTAMSSFQSRSRFLTSTTPATQESARQYGTDTPRSGINSNRPTESEYTTSRHEQESRREQRTTEAHGETVSPASAVRPYNTLRGFPNMGNTCYMNSVLQILLNASSFLRQLETSPRLGPTSTALKALASGTQHPRHPLMEIKSAVTKKNREFAGMAQCDAQEFLIALLSVVHDEIAVTSKEYREMKDVPGESEEACASRWIEYFRQRGDINSPVYDVFGGILKNSTTCSRCSYRSLGFDPFLDVSLSLPRFSSHATDVETLPQLVQSFMEPHAMNGYPCPKCEATSTLRRSTEIYKWPKVMIFHFKRFVQGSYLKLSNKVDLSPTLSVGKSAYKLGGLVRHHGSTLTLGHYTADVLYGDSWFAANDEFVDRSSASTASRPSSTTYLALYDSDEQLLSSRL